MNKAFTLIELLVVVMIIGILSAVALPQYEIAVEKSRAAEALQNIRMIEEQMKLYLLENGTPSSVVSFQDISSVELSGGNWSDGTYETKYFAYNAVAGYGDSSPIRIEVTRYGNGAYYQFVVAGTLDNIHTRDCYNGDGDKIGSKICHSMESFGWRYKEGEI